MIRIADYCIRCCMCLDLHPDLFDYRYEEDEVFLKEEALKPERLEEVKEMAADCAVAAIVITKEK